jgi:DNA-binding response OmpR family regulator
MTESLSVGNPLAFIIEDHEGVAEICRVALEKAQFEVEVAPDGQIALDRLATITPALIVLDLHLPNVSGQQVLHYIRTNGQLAGTWVILTTADVPKAKDMQYDVDFVLEKPFSFFALYELAKTLRASNTVYETPNGHSPSL